MVTLGFPSPIKPTNSNNRATYSELQVQDYDLSQIQANVSTYTRNLQSVLSQKDKYVMLAQNATSVLVTTATTSIDLILDRTTQDLYGTYNLASGEFVASQDAVYSISVNTVATLTAGAATVLFLDIITSQEGNTITFATPIIGTNFYLNVFFPTLLSAGSTLRFVLRTDVAAYTLSLSDSTRIFVSWK